MPTQIAAFLVHTRKIEKLAAFAQSRFLGKLTICRQSQGDFRRMNDLFCGNVGNLTPFTELLANLNLRLCSIRKRIQLRGHSRGDRLDDGDGKTRAAKCNQIDPTLGDVCFGHDHHELARIRTWIGSVLCMVQSRGSNQLDVANSTELSEAMQIGKVPRTYPQLAGSQWISLTPPE